MRAVAASIVVVLTAAVAGLALVAPGVDGRRSAVITAINGHLAGPEVPYGEFSEVAIGCPRGWVATGGSQSPGATVGVYDGPSRDGRGWEASALNVIEGEERFGTAVSVVCIRGTRGVRVRAARAAEIRRAAKRAALMRLRAD